MIDQIERGHTQPIQSSNYLQSSQTKLYNPDFSTTQIQQHQIKPSMFDPPRQSYQNISNLNESYDIK